MVELRLALGTRIGSELGEQGLALDIRIELRVLKNEFKCINPLKHKFIENIMQKYYILTTN